MCRVAMLSRVLLPLYCSLVQMQACLSLLLSKVRNSRKIAVISRSWYIVYSIRSEDNYKLIEVRKNSLEIDCPPVYRPHLFVNSHGEYECSVIETNRIRQLLGLDPLEE